MIANCFQLDVYIQKNTQNSAAIGAAYRACFEVLKKEKESFNNYFSETVKLELICKPDKSLSSYYNTLATAYRNVEKYLLKSQGH